MEEIITATFLYTVFDEYHTRIKQKTNKHNNDNITPKKMYSHCIRTMLEIPANTICKNIKTSPEC